MLGYRPETALKILRVSPVQNRMDGIRNELESALRELHGQRQHGGRSAARVRHILTMALRAPSTETLRRAVGEIECCYQSQGRGMGLASLRRLTRRAGG